MQGQDLRDKNGIAEPVPWNLDVWDLDLGPGLNNISSFSSFFEDGGDLPMVHVNKAYWNCLNGLG